MGNPTAMNTIDYSDVTSGLLGTTPTTQSSGLLGLPSAQKTPKSIWDLVEIKDQKTIEALPDQLKSQRKDLKTQIQQKQRLRKNTKIDVKETEVQKYLDFKNTLDDFKQSSLPVIKEWSPSQRKDFSSKLNKLEDSKNAVKVLVFSGNKNYTASKNNMLSAKRQLEKKGWFVTHISRDSNTTSSIYLLNPKTRKKVRLSTHELPNTPERQHNRSLGLTGEWEDDIVFSPWTRASEQIKDL